MNGPICRLAAATCLVVLTMVPVAARAEPIQVTEPSTDYPGLAEKSAKSDPVPDPPATGDTTMVEWPLANGSAGSVGVDTSSLQGMAAGVMMASAAGETKCHCTCPTPTPTPAEQAPEPGALVLFGLGSLGLALARRRR